MGNDTRQKSFTSYSKKDNREILWRVQMTFDVVIILFTQILIGLIILIRRVRKTWAELTTIMT